MPDGDLGGLTAGAYDLVLSAFTFDNIPTMEKKIALLTSLKRLLKDGGRIVNLVSAPDIYLHEWASFSTKDFPANRSAQSGDKVLIVMLDVDDRRFGGVLRHGDCYGYHGARGDGATRE